ncbi:hypothetical protein NKI46_25730 [Mesorhizobium sp. M0615]|uniref:hypothetical protein n=1 Tax=Mesorhizobium sp. M0615 TaxID=2956971 RepID=UPI003336F70D
MNYPSISMQLAGVFQNAAASIGACVLAICMSASLSPATGAEDTIASSNTDMSAKIERYRKANIAGFSRFVKKCQGGSDIKNAQCDEIHNKNREIDCGNDGKSARRREGIFR